MPHLANMRRITPRQLQLIHPYLDGLTTTETATKLGVSHETIRGALVNIRRQLRTEGYDQVHTSIGLRKALRQRGDIDKLETI